MCAWGCPVRARYRGGEGSGRHRVQGPWQSGQRGGGMDVTLGLCPSSQRCLSRVWNPLKDREGISFLPELGD